MASSTLTALTAAGAITGAELLYVVQAGNSRKVTTGTFVLLNGAGGTPTSLTLTNATGLPLTGLVASTTLAIGVGSVELGHATDTTIARSGAGDITVEGNVVYRAGGTDVPVTDGGTGRSTSTTAYGLIAAGTTSTGAHQTLAAGATTEILIGGGAAALPVWTTATGTGSPVRAGSPTFTGTLNAAAATLTGLLTGTDATFSKAGVAQVTIKNTTGTTKNTQLIFEDNVAPRWRVGMDVATSDNSNIFHIYSDTAVSALLTIETSGNVTINTGALQMGGANTVIDSSRLLRLRPYTVATLPAAGTADRIAVVTDATAPTYLGTLTGGGAVRCPVYDNGTAWVSF